MVDDDVADEGRCRDASEKAALEIQRETLNIHRKTLWEGCRRRLVAEHCKVT